mgnify:CR=1 FL=1
MIPHATIGVGIFLAASLQAMHHPKLVLGFDAILVMGPEHARVFAAVQSLPTRQREVLVCSHRCEQTV